jgi:serine/threonine protein kinase
MYLVPDDALEFLGASLLDDKPFIVMPFLKNGNAHDYIHNHPTCNRQKIVSIFIRLSRQTTCHARVFPVQLNHISLGLAYLHSRRIVHGDLKAVGIHIRTI